MAKDVTWPRIKTDAQLEQGVQNGCELNEHEPPRPCDACRDLLERVKASNAERRAALRD